MFSLLLFTLIGKRVKLLTKLNYSFEISFLFLHSKIVKQTIILGRAVLHVLKHKQNKPAFQA